MLPSPLIALLSMSLLSVAISFPVQTIGEIPSGLPALVLPAFSAENLPKILAMALALSALGVIDSLLTSIVADSMTKERHDSNQELIGQGVGNMAAALIGGLPGAGATMRTVVNIKAGGTTRLSGMIHSVFLVAVLLGLGKYTAYIPMPVLAGILMKVGVDILDYRMLEVLGRAPRQDLVVMLTVFAVTVFVDLIVAVGVGVTLAGGQDDRPHRPSGAEDVREAPAAEVAGHREGCRRERLGSGDQWRTAPSSSEPLPSCRTRSTAARHQVVVVDRLDAPFMDLSAVFALSEMVDKLKKMALSRFWWSWRGWGCAAC